MVQQPSFTIFTYTQVNKKNFVRKDAGKKTAHTFSDNQISGCIIWTNRCHVSNRIGLWQRYYDSLFIVILVRSYEFDIQEIWPFLYRDRDFIQERCFMTMEAINALIGSNWWNISVPGVQIR